MKIYIYKNRDLFFSIYLANKLCKNLRMQNEYSFAFENEGYINYYFNLNSDNFNIVNHSIQLMSLRHHGHFESYRIYIYCDDDTCDKFNFLDDCEVAFCEEDSVERC